MVSTTHYLGGVKFEVESRGHRVICDQPVDNSGTDEGMSPPELLLASLGTCAAFYAARYLSTRALPTDGLKVIVLAEKALRPARLDWFRIQVITPELDERHREGVLRAVKSCLIHNTLLDAPAIEIELHSEAPAAALSA